jgi:hypothetical protein
MQIVRLTVNRAPALCGPFAHGLSIAQHSFVRLVQFCLAIYLFECSNWLTCI